MNVKLLPVTQSSRLLTGLFIMSGLTSLLWIALLASFHDPVWGAEAQRNAPALSSTNNTVALAPPTQVDPCLVRQATLTTTLAAGPTVLPQQLRIQKIDVTQMIISDHPDYAGKYVPERSTAVLAQVKPIGSLVTATTVWGCLHVYANRVLTKSIPARSPITIQPGTTAVQLIFEPLMVSYTRDVDLVVEVVDALDPLNTLLAFDRKNNLAFVLDPVEPLLFYAPVQFRTITQTFGPPPPAVIGPPNGDAFLRTVLPVSDQADWWYRAATQQPIYISEHSTDSDHKITCGDANESAQLLGLLEALTLTEELSFMRETLVTTHTVVLANGQTVIVSVGSMEHKLVYGWVADPQSEKPVSCNGETHLNAGVSFGTTIPQAGQRTYAHEMFHHIAGPGHAKITETIATAGWDVGKQLPASWTVMSVTQEKRAGNTYVIMTTAGAHPTHETWIGQTDYNKALAYFCGEDLLEFVHTLAECPADPNAHTKPCILKNNVQLSAAFTGDGVALLTRRAIAPLPWYSQPTASYTNLRDRRKPFAARFSQNEQLIAEIPFDASVVMEYDNLEDEAQNLRYGYFNLVIPAAIVDQADRIEIRNINGDLLPFAQRSSNSPTITIVGPPSPDIDSGAVPRLLTSTITITTADLDGGDLTCHFAYSPDAGATWLPLQVRPAASDDDLYATRSRVPCPSGTAQQFYISNYNQLRLSPNQSTATRAQFPSSNPEFSLRAFVNNPSFQQTGNRQRILRAFVSDGFNTSYSDISVRFSIIVL